MNDHSYVGSAIAPIPTITISVVILAAPNATFFNVLSANSVIRKAKASSNHISLIINYGNYAKVKEELNTLIRSLSWESVYIWNKRIPI